MYIALWAIAGFAVGSVPWAVWLVRALSNGDVRSVGDRNPGSANAWKAAGWRLGLLVFVLDVAKGAVPVYLASELSGVDGWGMMLVGIAPVAGHAFSPLLRFKGGKALATSVGTWAGVTLGPGFLVIFACLGIGQAFQRTHVWSVMLASAGIVAYVSIWSPEPWLYALWAANTAIIMYKHRAELRRSIEPRSWVRRVVRRA
ncbi:MAG: glycerol-3-phosphate acyltransferase [SAR202 cluster bacterium]|nr:glycerol-3-phosphate acyltransferase [SAR202 cluster bacterium]